MGRTTSCPQHELPETLKTHSTGVDDEDRRLCRQRGSVDPVRAQFGSRRSPSCRRARTTTGHRLYTDKHLSALHCYQALTQGHGVPAPCAIMIAVYRDDTAEAFVLVDASHRTLHEQCQALAQTTKTLNAVSSTVDEQLHARAPMSIGEPGHLLGVRASTLRVWGSVGLLTPQRLPGGQHRSYDADNERDTRVIGLLRQVHYRFTRIKPLIEELRNARTGAALRSVLEERHAAFSAHARAMLQAAAPLGQHLTAYAARPRQIATYA